MGIVLYLLLPTWLYIIKPYVLNIFCGIEKPLFTILEPQ